MPAPDDEPFAYLTTTGRVTGRPHRIEIWFARHGDSVYMLAGGGESADWVANLRTTPSVEIEIGGSNRHATARVVTDSAEAGLARRLLFEKYQPTYSGDLSGWRERALPVVVDLGAPGGQAAEKKAPRMP